MTTTYKPVSAQDIDTVIAMMRDFYAMDGYPINVERSEKLLAQFISHPDLGRAWLIASDGEPVGYIVLTFIFSFEYGGTIAFVDELYLSERARGKGIGKASISFVKAEAAKLSLKLLYLEVEHHNSVAQKLYLSAGFREHNRKFMQYKIN